MNKPKTKMGITIKYRGEYVAASVAAYHTTWLRELLREIGCADLNPNPL